MFRASSIDTVGMAIAPLICRLCLVIQTRTRYFTSPLFGSRLSKKDRIKFGPPQIFPEAGDKPWQVSTESAISIMIQHEGNKTIMTSMNISLPEPLKTFVEEQVSKGGLQHGQRIPPGTDPRFPEAGLSPRA